MSLAFLGRLLVVGVALGWIVAANPEAAMAACYYDQRETNASQEGSWGYSVNLTVPYGSTCYDINVYHTSDVGWHRAQYRSAGVWHDGSGSPSYLPGGYVTWIPIYNILDGSTIRFGYQGATSADDSIVSFYY